MSSTQEPSAQSSLVAEKLRRLPASAGTDYALFKDSGDQEALHRLVVLVLVEHAPDKSRIKADWSDETRLVEDVGFDSLSIAETVFFFEDLFQISISNEEIMQLRTLGDLRGFVSRKILG